MKYYQQKCLTFDPLFYMFYIISILISAQLYL